MVFGVFLVLAEFWFAWVLVDFVVCGALVVLVYPYAVAGIVGT